MHQLATFALSGLKLDRCGDAGVGGSVGVYTRLPKASYPFSCGGDIIYFFEVDEEDSSGRPMKRRVQGNYR